MTYRIGFIGTGNPDGDGFAMAYRHAAGYDRLAECDLVACADIVERNAAAFAEAHGIAGEHVYESYETMLDATDLDVVSVCVPPKAHADVVTGAAELETLRAIHCEKPMAFTWGDAKRMATTCERAGVRLTINHQLRFGAPYREAKRLLDEGKVGNLQRVEFYEEDLYDNGTHAFDLANFYADHAPVKWVLAQVDYTEENMLFGVHNENQALSQWRYTNGVDGLAATGRDEEFIDALFRLRGSEGVIEVRTDGTLAYRHHGESWQTVSTGCDGRYAPEPSRTRQGARHLADVFSGRLADRIAAQDYTQRAIEEVITSLDRGDPSELRADLALEADELIFASWESSRRRGRVDLPLDVDDNPLQSMIESGVLNPEPAIGDDG